MTGTVRAEAAKDVGMSPPRLARIPDYLDRLIARQMLPHYAISIERRGTVVLERYSGQNDDADGIPILPSSAFRIYSMTKPVTTVAALSIYEEGAFQLDQPVCSFLPEFSDQRVYTGTGDSVDECTPASRPITIRDLLTHTSGITSHRNTGYVEKCYAEEDLLSVDSPISLEEAVSRLADLPLCFQPGRRWKYGLSTDVLGRILEVIANQPLDEILKRRVLDPLGMTSTGFFVADDGESRLACNYSLDERGRVAPCPDAWPKQFREHPVYLSGGGGLVSTLDDYKRFVALLRGGGNSDQADILAPKTLALMTSNHLPGDLAAMGQPSFMETTTEGIGFGFNVAVMIDPIEAKIIGTPGEYGWGGLASTFFFIDPTEELSVVFMTQVTPSSAVPIRRPLRTLVYQSIVDPAN